MWEEARKQEKKIKGIMVDVRKRAERRRGFYDKIKADPVQFLQVHGRRGKINIDYSIAQAAENPSNMMPWLGDTSNMIDRFDVRSHLDEINENISIDIKNLHTQIEMVEERKSNYERYRVLVHLNSLGITQSQHLQQIKNEEDFTELKILEEGKKRVLDEKKKKKQKTAAIGYVYSDDENANGNMIKVPYNNVNKNVSYKTAHPRLKSSRDTASSSDDDPEDLRKIEDEIYTNGIESKFDLEKISIVEVQKLGAISTNYGIVPIDFIQMVQQEKEDKAVSRLSREMEEEKALFSGKKGRKERRLLKEKWKTRRASPPIYESSRHSPNHENDKSKSKSPIVGAEEIADRITYITSFGAADEYDSLNMAAATCLPDKEGRHREEKKERIHARGFGRNIIEENSLRSSKERHSSKKYLESDRKRGSRSDHKKHRSRERRRKMSRSRSKERRYRDRDKRERKAAYLMDDVKRKGYKSRGHEVDKSGSSYTSYSSSDDLKDIKRRKRDTRRDLSHKNFRTHGSRSNHSKNDIKLSTKDAGNHKTAASSTKQKVAVGDNVYPMLKSETISVSPNNVTKFEFSERPVPNLEVCKRKHRRDSLSSSYSSSSDSAKASVKRDESDDEQSDSSSCSSSSYSSDISKGRFGSSNHFGKSSAIDKSKKLAAVEMMKKRTASILNKLQKADRKAEFKRNEKAEQEKMEREEEMKVLTIKIRKKEREKRHKELGYSSSGSEKSNKSRLSPHSSHKSTSPEGKDKE
ncbi:unnamed protein product [Gordionus sp. m RMFG-2023]|uniref:CLK4-associating serine/arginine rich protein-like n=1 Tax=Gordionus sp. m RMFG-2023 TaxID=3053472 RepID=UPI0030E004D0